MKEETMLSINTIADYFLALANESQELITNMKLNKLVFYTQAWHLAIFKKPIIEEDFEAWVHGPVLPTLYQKYRGFTFQPIIKNKIDLKKIKSKFNPELKKLMSDIVEVYFPKTAYELEQLTHSEDPWKNARKGLEPDALSTNIITKESIQSYYSGLLPA